MAVYEGARPRTIALPGRPRRAAAETPALPRRRARTAVRLRLERERLDAELADLRSDLHRLGREPAIRKLGLDAGLTQLDDAIVLPAR